MIAARFKELSVEEVANTLTHGVGLLLSIAGFGLLSVLAFMYGDAWHIAGSIIYGLSLIVLYAASTIYHWEIAPHRKSILQIVDHCCIYLLIAGSYTPFLLVVLRGSLTVGLLSAVWGLALCGIILKVIFRHRFNGLGIALYLVMGWLGLFGIQPIYQTIGLTPMILVLAGGLSYTAGMIFFGWHRIRHHHAIFHVFVLMGSIIHFIVIARYVLA